MAKKQGICRNIDCDNYKQIVEVEAGEEFECPLCHQHLEEVGGRGGKKKNDTGNTTRKKLIIIIVSVLVLAGLIGGLVYAFTRGDDCEEGNTHENSEKVALSLNHYEKELSVGETDTLVAKITPEGTDAVLLWKVSKSGTLEVENGIVKAVKVGEGKVRLQAIIGADTLMSICKYIVKEDPTKIVKEDSARTVKENLVEDKKPMPPQSDSPVGPISLGWGTYDGPLSGRTPHGFGGSITVKSRHTIDLKKATGETVELAPGDKIMNVKMDNGRLRQGEIHFSDGRRKFISGL